MRPGVGRVSFTLLACLGRFGLSAAKNDARGCRLSRLFGVAGVLTLRKSDAGALTTKRVNGNRE
jgi:hypothetical protein